MINILLQINEPEQNMQQRITKASLSAFKYLKMNDDLKVWYKEKKTVEHKKCIRNITLGITEQAAYLENQGCNHFLKHSSDPTVHTFNDTYRNGG